MKNKRRFLRQTVLPLVAILALVLWQYYSGNGLPLPREDGSPVSVSREGESASGVVEAAYAAHRSKTWVEIDGKITRVLSDDQEGSRHQRFILELASGHTVMVAHNIDLVDRIPVQKGDAISLRGRYEWNDRGGVIHWTHHDPQGRLQGGWIKHHGQSYR
jgi:hypothetical protein